MALPQVKILNVVLGVTVGLAVVGAAYGVVDRWWPRLILPRPNVPAPPEIDEGPDPPGAPYRTLRGHTDGLYAVAISPDGALVASGGRDHAVKLWDYATGTPVRTLEGHKGMVLRLAFSPDGKTLASASED